MKANEVMNTGRSTPLGSFKIFELSEKSRSELAKIFPPKFPEFIGHHITYGMRKKGDDTLPHADSFRVVGYAINEEGLETLVVEVDGSTSRPDGKIFHITWSLDRSAGFKPVHSNDLLMSKGWQKIHSPINITATAKFY